MNFVSANYLIFLAVFLILFYSISRYHWLIALLFSCYFYGSYFPGYLLILFILILTDYTAGRVIETSVGYKRNAAFAASWVMNLGFLGFFKYFNWLSAHVLTPSNGLVQIISLYGIPIGLSFHTFQSLSYITDVYRGKQKAEKHLGFYALYVMFFFQLMAGPIERAGHLLPQIHKRQARIDVEKLEKGALLILWGFVLKTVIADRVALIVNGAYSNPNAYGGMSLMAATVFFSFQIYCDFAGYTAIARGSALLAGFDLVRNFDRPYLASSLRQFWHRWHISLSTWFRDYVYIPLGGSRTGPLRWAMTILVVFFLSGLWHGAGLLFGLWGLCHGIGLIAEKGLARLFQFSKNRFEPVRKVFQMVFTFTYVTLTWIFFRSERLDTALLIFKKIGMSLPAVSLPRLAQSLGALPFPTTDIVLSLASIVVLMACEICCPPQGWWRWIQDCPTMVRWSFYYALFGAAIILSMPATRDFIYFQF